MKKKYLIISISILLVLSTCLYVFISDNTEKVVISSNKESNRSVVNTNALTMMYETEADSGEYQVSSDTTWPQDGYVFNETLSKCENGSTLTWDNENKRVVVSTSVSDKCYVYFDKEPDDVYLASYIANLYTTDGANGLYYHDGTGSYTNANLEAGDNSYRYAGANPNNYVCFGSDEETCPTDNLYRIIGVFNGQVKLIKSTYATSASLGINGDYYNETDYNDETISTYYWNNSTLTNTWSESQLNTVNLNTNYLNSLGTEWSDLIATTNWQVGGMAYDNVFETNAQTVYNYEVGANTANTTYNAKIGLMYLSDFGYSASPEAWSLSVGYVDGGTSDYMNTINTENNWLLPTYVDWTISRSSDYSIIAFGVGYDGGVYIYDVNYIHGVRPSFYLESSVVLEGGSGTSADPYRI